MPNITTNHAITYTNFTHRRIATNDFLLETGKKETDSCAFCADSPEDDKIISTYFKNNNVRFKSRNSIKVVLAKFLHSTTANAMQLNHGVTQEIKMHGSTGIKTGPEVGT